jgi:hypothetical protein
VLISRSRIWPQYFAGAGAGAGFIMPDLSRKNVYKMLQIKKLKVRFEKQINKYLPKRAFWMTFMSLKT